MLIAIIITIIITINTSSSLYNNSDIGDESYALGAEKPERRFGVGSGSGALEAALDDIGFGAEALELESWIRIFGVGAAALEVALDEALDDPQP